MNGEGTTFESKTFTDSKGEDSCLSGASQGTSRNEGLKCLISKTLDLNSLGDMICDNSTYNDINILTTPNYNSNYADIKAICKVNFMY